MDSDFINNVLISDYLSSYVANKLCVTSISLSIFNDLKSLESTTTWSLEFSVVVY
jgi:hypothetical protein